LSLFNIILLFPRTLSHIKFIGFFKPLFDAYFGPYKDRYSFWPGLKLLIRVIFFALSAVGNEFSFIGGITLLVALLCVQGIMDPYKNRFSNIKESLILFDLVALYVIVLRLQGGDDGIGENFMVKLLINIVLASFFILIIVHCIRLKYGNVIKHRFYNMIKQLKSKVLHHNSYQAESLEIQTFSSEIPDVTYYYQEFQESLVAMDD